MTPPRTVSWNVLFILLALFVVLIVILAIAIAASIDQAALTSGTADVDSSLHLTLSDFLLIAALAVTLVAFLITILMMLFKSFTNLLYMFVNSLTTGFARAVRIGKPMRERSPKPGTSDGNCISHAKEGSG